MNKRLIKEINEFLIKCGDDDEIIEPGIRSDSLARLIMRYAHRNQTRENGEPYKNHPSRVAGMYRDLIGYGGCCPFVNPYILEQLNIPFKGVEEVALLHDVVEDTELTINDLEDIFAYCECEEYFNSYIKHPLECITHDERDNYSDYIFKCLEDPTAALVKMIDLQDNLFVLGLVSFDDKKYARAQDYLHWLFVINEENHFIENIEKYKKEVGVY